MLEAVNLGKTYISDGVDYEVLKNINLEIKYGECAAIIGKSGSGKSTLMHLLACLDEPTTGNVRFEGTDVSTLSEKQRDVLRNEKFGFVFQQFFLNGQETVFENVVLPMRIRGATQYRLTKDAMDALEAVGLKDKEDKRAKDLSGGEKQRVCIARALIGSPQIVFADEPTGNLDSNTGGAIEHMLFQMNKEKKITLIIVTHDTDLAAKCERVIEMKDGEVVKA
ncbi:MAG: ABC transporter ATP-binding protein [Acidobacteria bacterium]|jgi:putative ABC transport system ATP-binding protein|nr:ABC transporter ATP-binding protein [Acidobacteriota bacterium]